MKKILRKNKFTIIALVILIIFMFIIYQAKELFFPNEGKAMYGERLAGKVEVKKATYEEMKNNVLEAAGVESVTHRISGRIINVTIVVEKDMKVEDARKLSDLVVKPFNDSQKGYYNFQIFVKKEDKEENNFPIIGYKHHNSTKFSWTRDREKVEKEEE